MSHTRKVTRALGRTVRPWPYLSRGYSGAGTPAYMSGGAIVLSGIAALWHYCVAWPCAAIFYLYWVALALTVWLMVWFIAAATDLVRAALQRRAVRNVSKHYGGKP